MRHPEPAKPPAQISTHPAQRSIPAPSTSHARVGTHPTPSRRNVAGAEPNREGEDAKLVEKESRGVSAGKYRALKRKLQDAVDVSASPFAFVYPVRDEATVEVTSPAVRDDLGKRNVFKQHFVLTPFVTPSNTPL